MSKDFILEYISPAPEYASSSNTRAEDDHTTGLSKWALPLGNSHFGALIFGRTEKDCIQITENSVASSMVCEAGCKESCVGPRSFGTLVFEFGHTPCLQYKRKLSLNDAISTVFYEFSGTKYEREYFLSYPDNVLAMRFTTGKGGKLSFTLAPTISLNGDSCKASSEKCGRKGEVFSSHMDIVMRGSSEYHRMKCEGRLRVKAYGGRITNENGRIRVRNAESAEVFFTCGTNYCLESRVFLEGENKKKLAPYPDPSESVLETLNAACAKGYDALKKAHIEDYSALFGRVDLSIGGRHRGIPTNELIEQYKRGDASRYLEELVFQYGRYLLIASSRRGGYPANMQGTWCTYDKSSQGRYYGNVNVQTNYWHAHAANLAECFEAYDDYAAAYMPLARKNADKYILQNYPERFPRRGSCGWTVGAPESLYSVGTPKETEHSGVGTGAMEALLFWQHYDFTRDKKYLQDTTYPYLLEASRFILMTLEEQDGKMLAGFSVSPEQMKGGKPYMTKGCSFDQQMIYELFEKTLCAAEALRITAKEEPLLETIEKTMGLLDPIVIGQGRYIKEYREEQFYGEIGDPQHAHVSQLAALYPGSAINRKTPDLLDAAKNTLDLRGIKGTGSSAAHKLCLWARTGEEEKAYAAYKRFIKNHILPNLWTMQPTFRIGGNFGATAGVCEMLLQSNIGTIDLLPALPEQWRNGSFSGLCARGGFVIGCEWENRRIKSIAVTSTVGGICRLKFRGANRAALDNIEFSVDGDIMYFPTIKGETLYITIG